MTVRDVRILTRQAESMHGIDARLEATLRYVAEDLMDGLVVDQLAKDMREAGQVAHRAVFTDALCKLLAEHQAAAFEGALKGIRKRQLMDGEPCP
jgi:hypothetical protein